MLFPTARHPPFALRPTETTLDLLMCRPPSATDASGGGASDRPPKPFRRAVGAPSSARGVPSLARGLLRPPHAVRRVLLLLLLASAVSFASLYAFHRGFRRTVRFWRGVAPLALRYKLVRFRALKIDGCSPEELEERLDAYREASAPALVDLILRLGGIYVKVGQVASTIGQGILPRQYVDALRPLQDGVPPRGYREVSRIVERSTGRRMDELFEDFDERPIGAASVAQVHRATLRPTREGEAGTPVVVKVQYPEGETSRTREIASGWNEEERGRGVAQMEGSTFRMYRRDREPLEIQPARANARGARRLVRTASLWNARSSNQLRAQGTLLWFRDSETTQTTRDEKECLWQFVRSQLPDCFRDVLLIS